jgi:hypothetical protein
MCHVTLGRRDSFNRVEQARCAHTDPSCSCSCSQSSSCSYSSSSRTPEHEPESESESEPEPEHEHEHEHEHEGVGSSPPAQARCAPSRPGEDRGALARGGFRGAEDGPRRRDASWGNTMRRTCCGDAGVGPALRRGCTYIVVGGFCRGARDRTGESCPRRLTTLACLFPAIPASLC